MTARVTRKNIKMSNKNENPKSFKCCKKPFGSYICAICLSVYHESCLSRVKNIEYLEHNKINCCDGDTQKNNEQVIDTLEKTIQELGEESNGKTNCILRLRQQNESLLHDAEEAENRYIDTINQQKSQIEALENHLKELQDRLARQEVGLVTIGVQTMTIATQCKSTKSTSTTPATTITRCTQTITKETVNIKEKQLSCSEIKNFKKPRSNISLSSVSPQHNGKVNNTPKNKRRILLVADSRGRNLANILLKQTNDEYRLQSFLKPHSLDKDQIETAVSNSKDFTRKDAVVLWIPRNCDYLKEVILHLKHTNVILLGDWYKANIPNVNTAIYRKNLELLKWLHFHNLHYVKMLDCNTILSKNRKWHLCKRIQTFLNGIESNLRLNMESSNALDATLSGKDFQATGISTTAPTGHICNNTRNITSLADELSEANTREYFTDSQIDAFFQ